LPHRLDRPGETRAAKNATSTIPIAFTIGADPVTEGLIANLARPGGNLTGISILTAGLTPKRLRLGPVHLHAQRVQPV
jgi:putative ABC transport system substrate-binding protein